MFDWQSNKRHYYGYNLSFAITWANEVCCGTDMLLFADVDQLIDKFVEEHVDDLHTRLEDPLP